LVRHFLLVVFLFPQVVHLFPQVVHLSARWARCWKPLFSFVGHAVLLPLLVGLGVDLLDLLAIDVVLGAVDVALGEGGGFSCEFSDWSAV